MTFKQADTFVDQQFDLVRRGLQSHEEACEKILAVAQANPHLTDTDNNMIIPVEVSQAETREPVFA